MDTSSQSFHRGFALWKTILWVALAIIVIFLVVSVLRAKSNAKDDLVSADMSIVKNAAIFYKAMNNDKYLAEDSVFSVDSLSPTDLTQVNTDMTNAGSSLNIVVSEDGTSYASWAKSPTNPTKFFCVDTSNVVKELNGVKYPTKENAVCE